MISDWVTWVTEGFLAPRRTARQLIETDVPFAAILELAVLSYAIGGLVAVFLLPPAESAVALFERHAGGLLAHLGSILLSTALIFGAGRFFGGVGKIDDALVIVCWCTLLQTLWLILPTVFLVDIPNEDVPGVAVLLLLIWGGILFWLLASYVAELHGFRSVAAVAGVMVGTGLMLGVLISAISPPS